MSPLYLRDNKLLIRDNKLATGENCCCDECCIIGDGKGTIFLCAVGGFTCWGDAPNAHLFFSDCVSDPNTITIKGLGILGKVDQPTIEANVKYNGEPINISANPLNCPINEAIIRTSRIDCINITAQGTRITGAAQGWEHSPAGAQHPTLRCANDPNNPLLFYPGLVGGQGAYTITISDIDPEGNFLVYIKLGCNTGIGQRNPLFPLSPQGKNGTYFYVAGDNQAATPWPGLPPSSTLNGNPVLRCGPEGPMIESDILPNFGNQANWRTPNDCIVWLTEGWIVPV